MGESLFMTDWARKHLCDLASACKKYMDDPALSIGQHQAFSDIYALAHQNSSLPEGGGTDCVAGIVARVCAACRSSILCGCGGRANWQELCSLVHESDGNAADSSR